MSDKENAASGADEATLDDDMSEEQAWADVTGQDDDPAASDASSSDDSLVADADQDDEGHADEASPNSDDGDTGQTASEQRTGNPDFEEREKRYKGQIGALTRKTQDLQRQIAKFAQSKNQQRAEDDQIESLDQLREEYPDLIEPLLSKINKMEERMNGLSDQFGTMSEYHRTQLETHAYSQDAALEDLLPGWKDFVYEHRNEFWAWVDDQPKAIRDLAEASQDELQDAEATRDMIEAFRAHLNGGEAHQQQEARASKPKRGASASRRLAGAQTVPTRGSQSATGRPQPDETDEVKIWNSIAKG